MIRWLACLAVAAACTKSQEAPPAPPPPAIPEVEVQRAVDACEAYVAQSCKCAETVAAAKEACAMAKALPEAIDVSRRLATNPKAEREDAKQAAENIRKTVKSCIEQTLKLHDLGCP